MTAVTAKNTRRPNPVKLCVKIPLFCPFVIGELVKGDTNNILNKAGKTCTWRKMSSARQQLFLML